MEIILAYKEKFHALLNLAKIFMILVFCCLLALIVAMLFRFTQKSDIVMLLATGISMLALYTYYKRIRKVDMLAAFQINTLKVSSAFIWLGFGMICNWIFVAVSFLLFPGIVKTYGIAIQAEMLHGLWLNLFFILILSPVFEEFLFRGILAYEFKQSFSSNTFLIVQAILFSVMHDQVLQIGYTFLLGLILGYIYIKFKNLMIPLLVHFGFNFAGFLIFRIF